MKTQYITDTTGKKTGVILPIRDYEKILEDLEELDDIKAYDRAKTRKSEPIPFEQALKKIELLRCLGKSTTPTRMQKTKRPFRL